MAEQDGILVKAKEESILEVIAEANSCMKAGGALFRENAMFFALNKYDEDPIRAFGFLAYSWRRLQTVRGRCRSVTYSRNFWQRPQVRCRLPNKPWVWMWPQGCFWCVTYSHNSSRRHLSQVRFRLPSNREFRCGRKAVFGMNWNKLPKWNLESGPWPSSDLLFHKVCMLLSGFTVAATCDWTDVPSETSPSCSCRSLWTYPFRGFFLYTTNQL